MSHPETLPSIPPLHTLPQTPDSFPSLKSYLETLSLSCTLAANDRSLDPLVETFYSPTIASHLEATDTWIRGPTAHSLLKRTTLTEAGVRVEPVSASATIHEGNVVRESGKGRKGKWEGPRFASVFVVTRVVKGEGIVTESVAVLHWEKVAEEDGGRWLVSGYEGMRGRASSFGLG